MAVYHVFEFRKTLKEMREVSSQAIPTLEPDVSFVFAGITATPGGEIHQNLSRLRIAAEANVLAFSQSVHAMADILAASIFYAYGSTMSSKVSGIRDVSIFKIGGHLSQQGLAGRVVQLVTSFAVDPDFLYLADFVNASKHEHLVSCTPTVHFEEGRSGFRIAPFFERKGATPKRYDEKWVEDFIVELNGICERMHEIGRQVNQDLGC